MERNKAKVGVIRGTTLNEIKKKKFNIYVGISLGNKWFTKENIKNSLLWCLKYTKDRAGLLIGDTLHAINYEVRNGMSPEKARSKALKKGDEMEEILKEIINELPPKQKKKVDIIRWDDVKSLQFNKKFLQILYKEYETNSLLRKEIIKIVDFYLSKDRKFSKEQKLKLGTYVIEEMPELLNGFNYNGIYYNCYTYPYDGLLNQMIEKIQNKKLLPKLHKKLDIKNHVFVELRSF